VPISSIKNSFRWLWLLLAVVCPGLALAEIESSLHRELARMGIEAPVPLPIELSERRQYTESEWFNGGEYFLNATIGLSGAEDVERLTKLYRNCQPMDQIRQTLTAAWEGGEREIPLTSVLPPFVGDQLGQRGRCLSNCWNATLNFHGATKMVWYTQANTILKVLQGPGFRSLRKGDQLLPGDVFAIFAGLDSELAHTAAYLGGNAFFHKGSANTEDPYTFELFEDMTRFYRKNGRMPVVKIFRRLTEWAPPKPSTPTDHVLAFCLRAFQKVIQ
jgi:hypothetical protein